MKTLFFSLLFVCSTVVSAQSNWKADKAHSSVNFTVIHLMISEVNGHFDTFDIEATADDTFSNPMFNTTIETASINTGNERRDNDLRSERFFNAEANPTITFKSTGVEKTSDNTYKLTGDLTMHGITKSIELNGKIIGIITNQRNQKLKAGMKFTTTLKRSDFDIGGSFAPVSDEVEVAINLEMAQQ